MRVSVHVIFCYVRHSFLRWSIMRKIELEWLEDWAPSSGYRAFWWGHKLKFCSVKQIMLLFQIWNKFHYIIIILTFQKQFSLLNKVLQILDFFPLKHKKKFKHAKKTRSFKFGIKFVPATSENSFIPGASLEFENLRIFFKEILAEMHERLRAWCKLTFGTGAIWATEINVSLKKLTFPRIQNRNNRKISWQKWIISYKYMMSQMEK